MDRERFAQALTRAGERRQNGIGTLGEKTLHAVLKYYFEPYEAGHEVKLGGYVADIAGEHGILEVQTRGFEKLRRKLEAFLPVVPVTVVYPIPALKWLRWLDPDTGEASERHRSPKRAGPGELLPELYKIKPLLGHPNLAFCIVMLEVEEIRWLNGWSRDRKRGSVRFERIPLALLDELTIRTPEDYRLFLPDALPELFTSESYRRASKLSLKRAQTALNVLYSVGALERVRRDGHAWVYRAPNSPVEKRES